MRDPFSRLANLMKDFGSAYNPPAIGLAEVISPSPNLVIRIGDVELDADNLLVADNLLGGYKRQISVEESPATGNTYDAYVPTHGSHSHSIEGVGVPSATMEYLDDLTIGDTLAVMPTIDKQTFIILARVVSLQ